jgi:dienelactone hydrolase
MAMNRSAAIITAGALAAGCSQALQLMDDDSATVLARHTIDAPNPAEPGPFAVKTLFYGSGTDKQRREYRDGVAIKTTTVDASPFATIQAAQARSRRSFFGFDLKKAPINARVWYPDGPGPFPLALIVHGNHNPREFSDPGYAWLGELLASRGFIMASVDENFINGLSGENDARAWLLLKHLEAWKAFNETEGGPFYRRVDMTRIALMGHSRGGEAAAHAAAFNRLKYYPDDFKQEFRFNFDIKAVVAIAPVDGQYKPTGQFTPLENVNYLLIHGSHDGDVSTFSGVRQYERLRFTDGQPWFKSLIFMYRANHGQWNTVWGNKDRGPRSGRSLDLRALIDGEAQRQFGKVVIAAFLEAALNGRREYLPLFRDHRTAGGWLPKTMYTTRFQESGYRALAEFDDDVDLTTGTAQGVVLTGEHLSTWRENAVPFRGRGNETQNHNAVWIGWNNQLAGGGDAKEKKMGPPASYAVSVPAPLRADWNLNAGSALYLSLAATTTKPGPRSEKKEGEEEKSEEEKKAAAKKQQAARRREPEKKDKEKPDLTPVDLTIELADASGRVSRLPLSRFGIARKPLDSRIFRREGRDAQRFANIYELIPQTFVMPLADFVEAAPEFDPSQLASIRLLFDRTEAGTVVVQHIGLRTAPDHPAGRARRSPGFSDR